MKQARVLAICSLGVLCAAGLFAQPVRALKLGSAAGSQGQSVDVTLTLDTDSQVQGLVAAADWDSGKLQGVTLTSAPALANADVVVPRVADGFFVLGVVMDSDGADGEIIPVGVETLIATLTVKCLGPTGAADETVPLTFQDGKYNTKDLGPVLDNIIVVGGLSIGAAEGLQRVGGSVTCRTPPPGEFRIVNTSGFFGDCVKVPVELANNAEVQGYVTGISHPSGLTLQSIAVGAAAGTPDFFQPDIFPTGGTLGVVLELDGNPPFQTIPPGGNNVIALYEYCTAQRPLPDPCPGAAETFALTFVDTLGDPVKENLIVVGGLSRNPTLINGTLSLSIDPADCVPPGESDISFAVGACDELVDDPNSDDKDDKIPGVIRVQRGTPTRLSRFQVGLYYKSLEDDEPDEANQKDHLQGVSMALCYDPACIQCDETFSLAGTITEAVGAEFVNVHCENDTTDGDPGELIVGILVDALPPFDGQALPPSRTYLKLICVDFHVNPDASCTTCATTGLTFCDGADGRGRVPIRNLASVNNQSVQPNLVDGEGKVIEIRDNGIFIRGDCNGSDQGPIAVDIADAASVISFLFLTGTWKFNPPCLDACDANDDGRVDLADSVYILRYLFKFDRDPKPPFPEPGVDPSDDKLSCGTTTCPTV